MRYPMSDMSMSHSNMTLLGHVCHIGNGRARSHEFSEYAYAIAWLARLIQANGFHAVHTQRLNGQAAGFGVQLDRSWHAL